MTEENSTSAHLSVAMTTDDNETQTTSGNTVRSSFSRNTQFYFLCAVVAMGVVGTAGNGLILYALKAAKQHKKHPLIVNQNVLDVAGSFFLVVSYTVKLCDIRYVGALGYWLCITLYSEIFVAYAMHGSRINIAAITVERYLKVVHHVWSKNKLRPWMINSTMAFASKDGTNSSWYEQTRRVRTVHGTNSPGYEKSKDGTNSPWYEQSKLRIVHRWYE